MRLARLIVTFFYIGHAKIAPGSIASLVTTLIFYLFAKHLISYIFIIIILITTISAFFAVSVYTHKLLEKDRSEIVIDEVIGQSIPICLYEIAHQEVKNTNEVLTFYFIMFILFRIFDILKPYPVNYYDKNFKNGFGVVMDDVCAGLYVVAVLVLYMVFSS